MTQISALDNCVEVKNFPEIEVMGKRPSLSKKEKDKTGILPVQHYYRIKKKKPRKLYLVQ